jgi:hypothetical protein
MMQNRHNVLYRWVVAGLATAGLGAGAGAAELATAGTTLLPHSAGQPYAAGGLPDRIVLTPGADPARQMAVAFRTDARQAQARGQIAPALDGPRFADRVSEVAGPTFGIVTANGSARYHQLRFTDLQPDTPYVYRVLGADGWSEWFQFRTAAAQFRPFRFIYLGDTQNEILEIGSRTIRQAFHATASPALVLHAGDLVAQRDDKSHDDEWGEWHAAGGHHFATVAQLPAAGNHEYIDHILADGSESRLLGPHWPLGFALPGNGAAPAAATTYHVDYQGVRFIVLDGTAAIDLGAADAQTAWLDDLLADNPARWTVVLFHQPIYTCARPEDTAELKAAWEPVFRRRNVDLVLQGHDHCYGRLSDAAGREAGERARRRGASQGPVYVVSVTGAKMYALNDRAHRQPDRVAEDTQLYQVVDVEADRLVFRAYTATGRLYDGFALRRAADGSKRLLELEGTPMPVRQCAQGMGPDGLPCTAEPK